MFRLSLAGYPFTIDNRYEYVKALCRDYWTQKPGEPLLKVTSEGVTVYGTPFAGKEGLQENSSAPVAGIVLLHQAEANHIRRLSSQEAYPMLLNQTYRPKDGAGLMKTLELVQRLSQLPVYSMGCTIYREAVALAVQTLTGQELPS